MGTARIKQQVTIAGIDIDWTQDELTQDGELYLTPATNVGVAPTAWTKASASTGTATMETGHGLQTNDIVTVFWAGGRRYGVKCTVTVNSIALADAVSGSGGNDFPANSTAIVLCKEVTVSPVVIPGDALSVIVAKAAGVALLRLIDAGGNAKVYDLSTVKGVQWNEDSNLANPLDSFTVATAIISTQEVVATVVTLAALYDVTA